MFLDVSFRDITKKIILIVDVAEPLSLCICHSSNYNRDFFGFALQPHKAHNENVDNEFFWSF